MNKVISKKKIICKYYLPIILSFFMGAFFSIFLNSKYIPTKLNIINFSILEIFFHNIVIAILLSLTVFISMPILMINAFTLGMAISLAINLYGLERTIFLLPHLPLEVTGWFLSLNISIYLQRVYSKKLVLDKKKLLNLYIGLLVVYFLAAVIEYLALLVN
ncbi:stage II sporulation protein M [Enterococcus faecalis]|uniref:stage II sporulation protein M n=1 Tax=Enterococcus faecalis TaxID=1351 RepID=UPI000353E4B6|nr:stage II sporulation protein M [Enterococcus faecalis]EPI39888.1 membrane protein [Enterococcus faecalis LA3B-2]